MNTKIFIGIAGGTASGKSAIAKHLVSHFKENLCATIKVDSYYHDLKHLSMQEREKTNFDSPKSIDFSLLLDHITKLRNNNPIKMFTYLHPATAVLPRVPLTTASHVPTTIKNPAENKMMASPK